MPEPVTLTFSQRDYSLLKAILEIADDGLAESSGYSQEVIDSLYSVVFPGPMFERPKEWSIEKPGGYLK